MPASTVSSRLRRRAAAAALATAFAVSGAGCTSDPATGWSPAGAAGEHGTASGVPTASTATIRTSIADGARVPVDERLTVRAGGGELRKVVVRGGGKRLGGRTDGARRRWSATDRLEPGLRYRVRAVAVDDHGLRTRSRSSFRTEHLTLDQQTFPSIAPLDGETVGVGMPVIVLFDVPVTDRAAIERHLSVESEPAQTGAWAWLSDHEVHWRPKRYWKPGTEVTVHADVNSVPAGNGVYGQVSRSIRFTVGPAMVSRVDVAAHTMKVFRDGELLRTIPVTAGKDGFTTRSGTKVVMETVRHKTMDAATIGIEPGDPEYYRLDVEYALRVTYSGEFIHGAPWSSGSQGSDNVSHGCVGMSLSDAAWLFGLSRRGDVVHVTGTDRPLEHGNGYTEWNQTFAEFKEGSAL